MKPKLTNRLQVQAIADLLAGLRPDADARQFSEPWRAIYRALLEAPPKEAQTALLRAAAGRGDGDSLIAAILAAVPGERLDFPSLHEIADSLPPITWLRPDWIPRGMISLLGAVPGAGKSYLALDLARRVIHAQPFPGAAFEPAGLGSGPADAAPGPGAVIYVDAEDVPQVIKQRAESWNLDTARLYLMRHDERPGLDLSQPSDQDHLREMANVIRPALIVVDSLSSISSKAENNVEDVREVLGFLNRLAQKADCGLLLVHHLRKRGLLGQADVLSVDDFRGSGHIIAMARSVLGLWVIQTGPKPDRNGPRRLEIVKTNLARYPEPLGVEFLPAHPSGVTLQYGLAPSPYRAPNKLDLCQAWLLASLGESDEPLKPAALVELARKKGFGRATLYKARSLLGPQVRDTHKPQSPSNKWELAEEA